MEICRIYIYIYIYGVLLKDFFTKKESAQGCPRFFFAKAPGAQDTHKTLSRSSVLGAQGGVIFRPRPQHKTRTRPPAQDLRTRPSKL